MVFDDYLWDMMSSEQDRPRFAIDSFLACFFGQYDEILRGNQIGVRKRDTGSASGSEPERKLVLLPPVSKPANNAHAAPPQRRRRSKHTRH
jgi:hypothetical protein